MSKGKRIYEVLENESIEQCLQRIADDGYAPIKRTEKPIFKEQTVNGVKEVIPIGRSIVFEAKQL